MDWLKKIWEWLVSIFTSTPAPTSVPPAVEPPASPVDTPPDPLPPPLGPPPVVPDPGPPIVVDPPPVVVPPKPVAEYPSDLLDLRNWKLTLPTGSQGSPDEIKNLRNYSHAPYFSLNGDGTGVVFQAPVNGVTTSGSKNPRSELREMTASGGQASWGANDGKTHRMRQVMAFTKLPSGKTGVGVVGGQVHDSKNDICVWRLEGTHLYATNANSSHAVLVDANYVLGKKIETTFIAGGGKIQMLYNGKLVQTIKTSATGLYYKAGSYVQCGAGVSPNNASNVGEATYYELSVSHS